LGRTSPTRPGLAPGPVRHASGAQHLHGGHGFPIPRRQPCPSRPRTPLWEGGVVVRLQAGRRRRRTRGADRARGSRPRGQHLPLPGPRYRGALFGGPGGGDRPPPRGWNHCQRQHRPGKCPRARDGADEGGSGGAAPVRRRPRPRPLGPLHRGGPAALPQPRGGSAPGLGGRAQGPRRLHRPRRGPASATRARFPRARVPPSPRPAPPGGATALRRQGSGLAGDPEEGHCEPDSKDPARHELLVLAVRRLRLRTAMVMSGGAARGAYEAGVISYLRDELEPELGRPLTLDILAGTSVGAINACFLAASADDPASQGRAICERWKELEVRSVLRFGMNDVVRIVRELTRRTPPVTAPDASVGGLVD